MPSAIDPLSLDNKFRQRDLLNEDIEALSQSIGQIRDACNAQCDTALSGCTEHLTAIIEAYRAYYLNPGPGRWHSNLHAYHEELQAMFDQGSSFTLEDIQARATQELRQHTKQELCTPNPSDPKPVAENKLTTSHMLDDGVPLDDCVNQYLNGLSQQSPDEETARFLYDLQTASSWEERTQLYIRHYCTPLATDSPKVVNFKAKYARYFQEGGSHDEVIAAMKSEAESSKYAAVRGLQKELEILQMGKSAHLKSQARKAEKDQKTKDASPATEPETATCSFSGCDQKVTLEDEDFGGPVECALCDWLSQKVEKSPRTFYCSKEHAEQDFAYHDRHRHTCISGNTCYYYPFPPPQDGITGGGVCPDCISQNQISYFCSQFCFRKNVSAHRASAHCGDGFDYRASLEMFEPSPEMVFEADL